VGRFNRRNRRWLAGGGIVSAVLLAAMLWPDRPLRAPVAPRGIISLELAGSYAAARNIIASWTIAGRRNAALSLWWDYVFLVAYALVLSLLCGAAAASWPECHRRIRRAGRLPARAQWAAALVKFTLIACGGAYIVRAGGGRLVRRFGR
jgi:hypothetical protein